MYIFLNLLLSVVLFALSFPNPLVLSGVAGLSLLALIPLFLALFHAKYIIHAIRIGMLFGLLTTLVCYFWLTKFGEFSIWTLSGTSIVYVIEYATLCILIWLIINYAHVPMRPVLLAIIWTGYEYFKSIGFLGFPWTLLAHSFHDIPPVIQIAHITGTWGLSFIIAYINASIFEWYISRFCKTIDHHNTYAPPYHSNPQTIVSKPAYFYVHPSCMHVIISTLCLCSITLYGMIRLYTSNTISPSSKISTLLIQQNFDSWSNISIEETLNTMIRLTESGLAQTTQDIDLIVWSETTLPIPYQLEYAFLRELYNTPLSNSESFVSFLKNNHIPLMTGSPWIDTNNQEFKYNSAILIDKDAQVQGMYGKNQLVPFAEFIPFYHLPIVETLSSQVLGLYGTWMSSKDFNLITLDLPVSPPNTTQRAFSSSSDTTYPHYKGLVLESTISRPTSSLKIGTPICFEDSFSYITKHFTHNGADILLNLTNVSWSKTYTTQQQQLVASRFRSIETGLTLVRATNSGVTSVIDPWGRILVQIPMFEASTLETEIPIYKINTPYMQIGDSIGIIFLVWSTLLYIMLGIRMTTRERYITRMIRESLF